MVGIMFLLLYSYTVLVGVKSVTDEYDEEGDKPSVVTSMIILVEGDGGEATTRSFRATM